MRFRALALVAAVGLVATLGTACGDDDKDAPVYTITARESGEKMSFDIPDGIDGGVVTFDLVSPKSNKAPHDFQLLKLDGHDYDEALKSVTDDESPVPAWIEDAGGAMTVAPGKTSTVTLDLEPNSTYMFFCTESDEESGTSHAGMGMAGTFETGDDSGADLPDADATITAREYTFDMSGLKAGENLVKFENTGKMLHHALLLPIKEGSTFADAKKALMSEDESAEPPVEFEKGTFTAVFGPGDSGVMTMNLKAGDYAVICFMPDKGTVGPPHIAKGMIKELKIS
jgi:uncharacterized cupredoxin-like copper-binding protein